MSSHEPPAVSSAAVFTTDYSNDTLLLLQKPTVHPLSLFSDTNGQYSLFFMMQHFPVVFFRESGYIHAACRTGEGRKEVLKQSSSLVAKFKLKEELTLL